jgi:archaemetzincin
MVILLILPVYILLSSCSSSSKPQETSGGNIDVDSDIYIIPIGDDVEEKHLQPLVARLENRFTTNVHLAMDKRMPNPDYAYEPREKKHVAMYILSELIRTVEVPGDAKMLGVVNVDIFVPESNRSFIFGQAHVGRNAKAAIISMLRMNPNSYVGGKPDEKLLIERMTKEAVHELGHVFGLRNVADPECVMYLPKDLEELDKKSDKFCVVSQKAYRDFKQESKKPVAQEVDKSD